MCCLLRFFFSFNLFQIGIFHTKSFCYIFIKVIVDSLFKLKICNVFYIYIVNGKVKGITRSNSRLLKLSRPVPRK